MSYDPEPEIQRYLERLANAARDLPRGQRRELVAEIEQHIREALIETHVASEAEMLTLLDQIGDPDEIAAAARGPRTVTRSTTKEIWAIILLLIGGFLWGVGWIAGVVLLWSSDLWTLRDKLIGTFLVPGGLAPAFFLLFWAGSGQVCSKFGPITDVGKNGKTHFIHAATPWTCTGGPSTLGLIFRVLAFAVLVLGPIATAIYLGRRLNKQKHAQARAASAVLG